VGGLGGGESGQGAEEEGGGARKKAELRLQDINVDGIPEKFCSKLLDSAGRISNIFTCKQIAEERCFPEGAVGAAGGREFFRGKWGSIRV